MALPKTILNGAPTRDQRFNTNVEGVRALLKRCFGAEFSVLDATAGEYRSHDELLPGGDPNVRAEVCRQVIGRGRPEFIAEEDPVVLLAIPIPSDGSPQLAALAPFVVHQADRSAIERAAVALGCDSRKARAWAEQQTVWDAERLLALAEITTSRWANQWQLKMMQGEVDALSAHLLATYEEISLLYRLTQHLKLTGSNEQLGRLAMDWLSEAVLAEGFALYLLPKTEERQEAATSKLPAPVFLQNGRCPIDAAGFARLIELLELNEEPRPRVVNLDQRNDTDGRWPAPEVRQIVVVPMIEGQHLFGWLAAINHSAQGEFGSTEVNLLSSVAAILGIHAGNVELYRQQGEFLAGVVRALTSAIDAKDPYTCGHSDRVARVAVRLAKQLGCTGKELETIYLSGLLHDIGKIGIDDQVLRKPGKLTEAEYEHIKLHAEIGYRILKGIKQLDQVLPAVRHHHEAWNGKGYPFGLAGEEIPYFARIVSVADAFDAMSSDRPYRKGIPDDQLDAILREGAGKQWDARVVETFFSIREEIRRIMQMEPQPIAIKLVHDVVVPTDKYLPYQHVVSRSI